MTRAPLYATAADKNATAADIYATAVELDSLGWAEEDFAPSQSTTALGEWLRRSNRADAANSHFCAVVEIYTCGNLHLS
jgi:hypothetical protein